MTKSELQTFIDSLDDVQKHTDLVRCCSCNSAVLDTGKYSIKKYEGKEGVLCEDCNKDKREIAKTIQVIDPGTKTVQYVTIQRNVEEASEEAPEVQPLKEEITTPAGKKADTK